MMKRILGTLLVSTTVLISERARAEPDELLSTAVRSTILDRYLSAFDAEHGGFGKGTKRVDPLAIEYAMNGAEHGAEDLAAMAQRTLLKNLALIDPVWGGAYDSSSAVNKERPWRTPNHRKSMAVQAEELRLYVRASSLWGAREYLETARSIQAYIERFLTSPEGAFYAGQAGKPDGGIDEAAYFKLNDAERRKLGMPEVDRRIFARDNGLAIAALARVYDATGDEHAIERAIRAAEWIIAHRKLPGGGFMSGEDNAKGPRLGDSVAMGQAMLELYASTGDEKWLAEAEEAAFFIGRTFPTEEGFGFTTKLVDPERTASIDSVKDIAENVAVARFANLLRYYTGQELYRKMSDHAMRYLAAASGTKVEPSVAGVLIAEEELTRKPVQVIIVGERTDPKAQRLYRAALAHPTTYRVFEWAEPGPAPLRYAQLGYPRPIHAAAIACDADDCTPPAFKATDVVASLRQLAHR
jgi:uncharacterized protein